MCIRETFSIQFKKMPKQIRFKTPVTLIGVKIQDSTGIVRKIRYKSV